MPRLARPSRSSWFAVVVALVVTATVAAWGAPTAGAHGPEGELVLEATALGPDRADVSARLVYSDDGHGADGAVVTVTGSGPGGATLAPTVLDDVGNGFYRSDVAFPVAGAWELAASVAEPAASAAAAVELPVGPTPPETTAPAPTTGAGDRDQADGAGADDHDGGSSVLPLVLGIAAFAVAAALGAALARRRARR